MTIQEISQKTKAIFKSNNVKQAILFGSFATNQSHAHSDIDFVVDIDEDFDGFAFVGMHADLIEILNKDVDLIAKFDLIPNHPFEQMIKKQGVIVYDSARA